VSEKVAEVSRLCCRSFFYDRQVSKPRRQQRRELPQRGHIIVERLGDAVWRTRPVVTENDFPLRCLDDASTPGPKNWGAFGEECPPSAPGSATAAFSTSAAGT
jgi:hypothetical protein